MDESKKGRASLCLRNLYETLTERLRSDAASFVDPDGYDLGLLWLLLLQDVRLGEPSLARQAIDALRDLGWVNEAERLTSCVIDIDTASRSESKLIERGIDEEAAFVRGRQDFRNAAETLLHLAADLHAALDGRTAAVGVTNADDSCPDIPGVECGESAPANKAGRGKATFNARMIDAIQADPTRRGWSVRQWHQFLGCSTSTVHDQPMWKELSIARAALISERKVRNASRPRRRRH